MARRAYLIPIACLLVVSCSLDYGEALAEELGEDVPDSILYGFQHTVVENGKPRFRLEADLAENFQVTGRTRLTGVRFSEFNAGGGLVAEGTADSAVFFPDTETAELTGSVSFRRESDGLAVNSGYLKWDGEARLLTSRSDTLTTLRDGDGSRLSGAGFQADAARRSFSFDKGADGSFRGGGE